MIVDTKASETEVFNMTMKIAQQTLEIVKLRNKLTAIEDILKEKKRSKNEIWKSNKRNK